MRRRALQVAARGSGLEPERVHIHNAFLGGGFGRRDASDEIAQSIAIAKVVKRPVKLIWTREEDTRQDKFCPHAVVAFKAAAGSDGMPIAWSMRIVTSSIFKSYGIPFPADKAEPPAIAGLDDNGYNVRNTRVELLTKNYPPAGVVLSRARRESACLRYRKASSMRSPQRAVSIPIACGASFSKWQKSDWLKVLDTAAEKGDWGKPLPKRQRGTRHRHLQFYGQPLARRSPRLR